MKKIILCLCMSLLGYVAQAQTVQIIVVNPTKWSVQVPETHTETVNNKPAGAALGGTAGWLLIGGPIGVLGGALIGASVSDGTHVETRTTYRTINYNGYLITLSNGESMRVMVKYNVGQRIDYKTIKSY